MTNAKRHVIDEAYIVLVGRHACFVVTPSFLGKDLVKFKGPLTLLC